MDIDAYMRLCPVPRQRERQWARPPRAVRFPGGFDIRVATSFSTENLVKLLFGCVRARRCGARGRGGAAPPPAGKSRREPL
eukprot:2526965-Pyramimonas_sp.AAC.1